MNVFMLEILILHFLHLTFNVNIPNKTTLLVVNT